MSQPIPGPLLYESGKSSTGIRELFAELPVGMELMLNYSIFFDDFNGIAVNSTHNWTTVIDTNVTVEVVADALFGQLAITNVDAADNAGGSIQGNEVFSFVSGKKTIFECRVKTTDADDVDLFVGLVENHATNPEAVYAATGAGFRIAEADASILCKAGTALASSEDSGVDAADDTFVTLSMVYDGTDLHYYVNRVKKATMAAANIPSAQLTPSAGFIQGAAANDVMTIDYILVMQER